MMWGASLDYNYLPPTRRDSFFLGISCTLHKHSFTSPQRVKSSVYFQFAKATFEIVGLAITLTPGLVIDVCNCACACVCEHPHYTTIFLWLANDINVLYISKSSCSQTLHVHRHTNHQRLCVPLHPRTHTHTPEKKTVQVLWLRETVIFGWKLLQWP